MSAADELPDDRDAAPMPAASSGHDATTDPRTGDADNPPASASGEQVASAFDLLPTSQNARAAPAEAIAPAPVSDVAVTLLIAEAVRRIAAEVEAERARLRSPATEAAASPEPVSEPPAPAGDTVVSPDPHSTEAVLTADQSFSAEPPIVPDGTTSVGLTAVQEYGIASPSAAPSTWTAGVDDRLSAAAAAPAREAADPVEGVAQAPGGASPWAGRLRRAARFAALVFGGYIAVVLTLIVLYRFVAPPASTLMVYQWVTGTDVRRTWVPIENISNNLLRAVVVSEDWGFCNHYGVDLDAIEKAIEQAGDGIPRGASTISMQVIKNLFLTQSKSYIRKAIEIPLTVVAEAVWPKSRMLEIYLNIAEWGPGVFGAEAAAQHHFSKPAAKLSEREAALLAASLPNPMIRDAGDPGPRTARKATVIQARMRAAGPSVAACAMPPRAAPRASGWETSVKKRAGADP